MYLMAFLLHLNISIFLFVCMAGTFLKYLSSIPLVNLCSRAEIRNNSFLFSLSGSGVPQKHGEECDISWFQNYPETTSSPCLQRKEVRDQKSEWRPGIPSKAGPWQALGLSVWRYASPHLSRKQTHLECRFHSTCSTFQALLPFFV